MSRDIQMPVAIDEIDIGDGRREVETAVVKRLADSIDSIGLQHPITVRRKGERYALIAGRHRIEAFKKLGREHIPASIVTMTNSDARMWEIAENLHRAELTKLQRAEQIEEWRNLMLQAEARPTERATAIALGVHHSEVHRSSEIANITAEAKEAAHEAGIDDNQSKLLAVAKVEPSEQMAKVIELAAAPLNHFETQEQWLSAIMRVWNKGSKEWREEFLSRVDRPLMDRQYGTGS